MIRSVFLVVISIALTQCLPSSNEDPSLKLNKPKETNLAIGKLFGNLKNFTKPLDDMKSYIKYTNPDYEETTKEFGQEGEDDVLLGLYAELNSFEEAGGKDVDEVTVNYPSNGDIGEKSKFIVTYVKVYILADTKGEAEIGAGDQINQKKIGINISVKQTSVILYYVYVYGKYEEPPL